MMQFRPRTGALAALAAALFLSPTLAPAQTPNLCDVGWHQEASGSGAVTAAVAAGGRRTLTLTVAGLCGESCQQMVVHWLIENTDAIEVRRRDGRTYNVVTDAAAFRAGVARLLAEVQRIKSEGDYDAARSLFETYGIRFDPALRDEVLERVARVDLPSYTGFVMPKLEAVTGADGSITDVRISYPRDFTRQMLEYSGKR